MATWSEISRESLKAAGVSMRNDCYRSSVSRSYYGAYAAISSVLSEKGVEFSEDRSGPSHAVVGRLVTENMGHLNGKKKRIVSDYMRVLYERRIDADYRPQRSVDLQTARIALAQASFVASQMGVTA